MKKILVGILFLFFTFSLKAGSDTTFLQDDSTRYINRYGSAFFEGIKTNPAYTGLLGQHVINFTYRITNPTTFKLQDYYFDYSTNLCKNKNLGIGGYYNYSFIRDGFTRTHEINISVSYRINIIKNLDIRIGASAFTFNRFVLDIDSIRAHPATDTLDTFLQDLEHFSDWLDFNTGLWLNYYGFYLGFSYLNFLDVKLSDKNPQLYESKASYHINSGYDFRVAKSWGISPTFYAQNLFKDNSSFYQFGLFSDYRNIVFCGITYRDNNGFDFGFVGFKAGAMILKRIRFSLGYSFSTDAQLRKDVDFTNWHVGLRLQY